MLAPLPFPKSYNIWERKEFISHYDKNIGIINSLLSPQDIVCAQSNIGAYFAARKYIYPFPHKLENSNVVILHNYSPTTNKKFMQIDFDVDIEKMLNNKDFELVYDHQNWLVFKRHDANNKR